jgi:predicted outer membrane repeat protein
MNTQQRLKIYLVLILLAGVGLALAVPALVQAHTSTSGNQLAPSALDETIYYVAKTGDGTDGLSWATAYTDLQDALAEAVSGDQIWVARGVYIPGVNRSDSFQLVEGVAVYGGFEPTGGADQFSERDWEAYPTILSGDIAGDDTNTNGVVLTTTHILPDNSYHVVRADGTTTPITDSTVLDGFIITAGQANGGSVPDNRGGGYYCDGSGSGGECSPTLRNVTFSGNYAQFGGGFYSNGPSGVSKPSLVDVTFSGNYAAGSGGAMFNNGVAGDSSPSMVNVTFSGNSAGSFGGAMRNYGQNGDCHPSLSYVTFSGNHAESGGAMASHGSLGASNPSLDNVIFSDNSADNYGGAMYNHGSFGTSSPKLTNVIFSGNSAGSNGGAIYNEGEEGDSSPSLRDVVFSGNSADSNGGAMHNSGLNEGTSSPILNNVTFSGNNADQGGAMFNNGSLDGDSSPILSNVTFSGNSAGEGGAMVNYGPGGTSSLNMTNLILWANSAGIDGDQLLNIGASITITTSLVQGGINGGGVANIDSTVNDGGGNLDADPEFVRDPDPGLDGDWDGVDDDYGDLHLRAGSPAVDAGTNSAISLPTDLDGNPRIVDGDGDGTAIVDMGAYEFNCPAGGILYVDHRASGSGSSWLDAKPNLALGLKLVSYCPDVSQVWVATGVYTPGVQQSDSFDLVPGVALYGGFDPTGGVDEFSERDWLAYPTVLSGDIGGDDITDAYGVVTTTDHIIGDNSYHVVTADGTSTPITSTTVLDGFTITAGQANGGVPTVLSGDLDGGDVRTNGVLDGFTITAGQAKDVVGGGYYCGGSGSEGECSPSLRDITFSGNSAGAHGGAMYNDADLNGTSSPNLSNVTFSGNSAGFEGGAMYNDGFDDGTSNPSLEDVTFSGNSARWGGAMFNHGWRGTSSPSLANVTFSSNSAAAGGALYNYGSNGISSPSLANVTFSGNSADYGGAMYSTGYEGTCNPSLSNTILWGNTATTKGSQLHNYEASITITTSLVQGGLTGSGVYNFNSTVTDGGGNIDADPEFVRDPDPGPDGDWDGVDDDYGDLHLRSSSPAIDTGTNSAISLLTDLDGDPRVVDGDLDGTATVDMGAYELQTYALDVSLAGSGSGAVSGNGISCATGSASADCTETFPHGTIVTLTASTDPGSTFTRWSGACNHTGAVCTVALVAARSVTATFTLNQVPLSVSLAGTGGGSVNSTPPGIDCATGSAATGCTADFDHGTMVSLTAAADSGSTFSGWDGACTSSGDCEVTMTEPISVTAAFDSDFVYLPLIIR